MPPLDRSGGRRPRRAAQDTGPARRARWRNAVHAVAEGEEFAAASNASAARALVEEVQAHAPPVLGGVNWTPIGPAGGIRGQARTQPVISGRILAIEVGPNGNRAYAAAADGGAWQYDKVRISGVDHDVWTPLDDFVMSPSLVNLSTGNALTASALLVQFGANARADTVFVGTGEPGHLTMRQPQIVPTYLGIGVRVSPGAAGGDRVWHLEANNLRGQAIYRLVQDPDDPAVVWAASSAGLFRRPNPSGPNTAWTQIPAGAGNLLPGGRHISDVVITGSTAGANKRIFAAARGGNVTVPTRSAGVYVSADNGATWNAVPITPNSAANPGRIALAVSNTANQVVYRFDELGRLWRFDGAQFRRVQTLPPQASTVDTQGWWDIAVAVQPATDDTVYIAGSLIWNDEPGPLQPGEWDAAFYRSALTTAGAERRFGYAHGANPDRSPLWIGAGVHPDCHVIAFSRNAAGTALVAGEVWMGCDGGVFRSPDGTPGSFRAVNETLAITQPTYFDQHPTSDAIVVAGTQDNGTVRGDGGAVWRLIRMADGGGVAIDPNNPLRILAQNNGSTLESLLDGGLSGATNARSPILNAGETANMYARLVPSPVAETVSTVLYPTNRIWVSYDWGARWRVLPGNLAPAAASFGRLNGAADMISDVVWSARDRFHVTTGRRVYRYDRTLRHATNRNNDTWQSPPTALALTGLPGAPAVWTITALAVANPAADDIFIGFGGANILQDHVWWFDAAAAPPTWRPTGFGPGMVIAGTPTPFDAPVNAMVVDPANPNDLYVGTDVGVFLGRRAIVAPATTFSWTWTLVSNGLPEATVHDLKVHTPSRRLRASLHGRGVWELDLAATPTRSPDVYLRMNGSDGGRHLPASRAGAHPFQAGRAVDWTMSSDIKVRRTGTATQAPPAYPGAQLRFTTPRTTGANVTRWQAHVRRRGFTIGADPVGRFDVGSRQAARDAQSRYGLVEWDGTRMNVDGIVGPRSWAATTSYPPVPTPMTAAGFVDRAGEDIDQATDVMIADAGPNQVFVQVHNRGHLAVAAGNLRGVLLVAASDNVGTVNQLPAGYAARLRGADATAWLGASGWLFAADGANRYQTNALELNQRRPAILTWNVDFAALGLAAGSFALLVALVSATSVDAGATDNTLQATERTVRTLIEGAGANAGETKVVARLVRLDAVAAIP